MIQQSKVIPYGYKTYTGVVMTDSEVDRYNDMTSAIDAYVNRGSDAERLLNERNLFFCVVCGLFKKEKMSKNED